MTQRMKARLLSGRCRRRFGAQDKHRLSNLFQTVRRYHEHERRNSYFEQQKGLLVVALTDVYGVQWHGNGFGGWRLAIAWALSTPRLATQVQKHADQVFHVFRTQAELDRPLLAPLDLEADCIAVRRNVADDVNDKRHPPSGLCFLRAQSRLHFSTVA